MFDFFWVVAFKPIPLNDVAASLVGIFGVTLFMILIVYLLNLISNYGTKGDSSNNN